MSTTTTMPNKPSPSSNDDMTQNVPEGHQLIREGQITMLYPKSENSVFYNPVQVQNRDLSVLMIGMYAERRMERMWVVRRRKEVRKEMMQKQKEEREEKKKEEDGGGGEKKKKETKEERKAKIAKFEQDLEAQVLKDKSSVDFTKLTQESSNTTDGMSIFEALAASGLRSLRYWKEVPGVRTVVVNDLDPVAVEMARENVVRNGFVDDLVTAAGDDDKKQSNSMDDTSEKNSPPKTTKHNLRPRGLQLQVGDATHEMYISRLPPNLHVNQINPTQRNYQKPQYDVIDLDPYGSAAPFLDAAVQSVVNGGLLAVTCTDMAALGGSHPETCYGRYGAFPIQRSGYLQELALRILLYHMSVVAGRYGRTIRPVLSVGMAFYCRVFVEVYDDKAGVNNLSLNHGHLFQSTKCSSFHITPIATNVFVAAQQQQQNNNSSSDNSGNTNGESEKEASKKKEKSKRTNVYKNGRGPCDLGEPVCGETGAPYKIGGPLWIGPLHDLEVVNDAITRLEAAKDNEGTNPSGGSPLHPLHTATTLHGLLVSCSEEVPDAPLYHLLPYLCSAVNSPTIPMNTFKAALVNAGYNVSAYHKEPSAVKTNAPNHVVWDIVRAWCKENPPAKRKESKRHRKGEDQGSNAPVHQPDVDIATMILSKEMRMTKVDFTIPKGLGERKKAKRWALNPEANWGPKKAASGRNKRKKEEVGDDDDEEKKELLGDVGGEPSAKQVKA
eukprot:CAMPEP_0201971314 /NCGR_PEP_ID=MMETSP0904-20121228/36362_1 /ASSEMBLY_ACC=CAM_ASM_000553 /TAXON_ID=420261 /ORGANISM="Thalassiosira antarctica, Strain CCMP982" /LENGTH=722 /DNA_ID=CAMNT_0048520681 /DNA_START=193 /DNA_END=2361 /DNA_ORIENTATION=+